MPTAAKIASSSVGGSRRTRRVPYLVCQSSLIEASHIDRQYLGSLMLHCNMKLAWQSSHALQLLYFRRVVDFVAADASDCSALTKSREAGTAKCVSSAARSAHCSKKTSFSGFSQSTCTACEMQPGSVRERCTCSRLSFLTASRLPCFAVTLPVTTIMLPPVFVVQGAGLPAPAKSTFCC